MKRLTPHVGVFYPTDSSVLRSVIELANYIDVKNNYQRLVATEKDPNIDRPWRDLARSELLRLCAEDARAISDLPIPRIDWIQLDSYLDLSHAAHCLKHPDTRNPQDLVKALKRGFKALLPLALEQVGLARGATPAAPPFSLPEWPFPLPTESRLPIELMSTSEIMRLIKAGSCRINDFPQARTLTCELR